MSIIRIVLVVLAANIMVLRAGMIYGQTYPNKPIRIVTAGVGGSNDLMSRVLAQGLAGLLGQEVVVDNRGGNVNVPAQIVAHAPPDGYTLLLYGSALWIGPFMQKASYDPVRDFLPISLVGSTPNIVVVHPSLPVKSVKELIALARARPGQLNYASGGNGASNHLAVELFKAMGNVNIVRIAYKGTGPALNAMIAGEVHMAFTNSTSVTPHVKSGRLRALAVTSAEPSSLVPGLPAVAATLPGYESVLRIGMFAPAKTPTALINRLNQEIVRVLNTASAKEAFASSGSDILGSLPEQLSATINSEMTTIGKLIKDAGIRDE